MAFDGQVGEARFWPEAGDSVRQMEFSALREVGAYRIVVDDTLASAPFVISDTVYASALRSAVKAFYYNRASMPIEARYGGKWASRGRWPQFGGKHERVCRYGAVHYILIIVSRVIPAARR